MREHFHDLADHLQDQLRGREIYLAAYSAEDSDFVRFNHARVRQAMHVTQRYCDVRLIDGQRHLTGKITLSGERDLDRARLSALVVSLRERLAWLPDDPYLLYATEPQSTVHVAPDRLPPAEAVVDTVLRAGHGLDLVGLYASGGIFEGFANSLGQRNWFASYSHNLQWSLYHSADKAVRTSYAGPAWDDDVFADKMGRARESLGHLKTPARTIDAGAYRVYLSPTALQHVLDMLAWSGFGLKDHRTRQTPLIRMVEDGATLRDDVTIRENTGEGVAAGFQSTGYVKPDVVPLIERGRLGDCLTSPRSAREYGVAPNGAEEDESPESLDMAAGTLPQADVMERLGTGLWVDDLHYLNWSDRTACRMTGMTRFATFWVDHGRITCPVNVMRFDETLYRVLGDNLIALTKERDLLLDAHTFGGRATASTRLPGALVDAFTFTL